MRSPQSIHGSRLRFALVVWPVAAACQLFTVGCQRNESIQTYRVPKASGAVAPEPASNPTAPSGDPTDRMIGAIVPGGDQAWFFKVVGSRAEVDPAADSIKGFLGSLRVEGGRPIWELPDGWTEKAGGGMRLATLVLPAGGGEAEMSVIGLALSPNWDAQVLDNVNRWRKQLKLEPVAAGALATAVAPIDGVADGAVLIDDAGWFEGGTMAPFAGGGAMTRPAAAPPRTPSLPTAGGELAYETPPGWAEDPNRSAIRKVSLVTEGGAAVTGFSFPAAGAMSDPLQNVNRWRREIGLGPFTADELQQATEEIELLGGQGGYYELVGDPEATTAAMVTLGGEVWFFKLRGPKNAVAAENAAFREWLRTLAL